MGLRLPFGNKKPQNIHMFISLPDEKLLYWSELKQIADDILKCI